MDTEQKNPNEESSIADYVDGMKNLEMQGYQRGIRKARNALFITAALIFIGELISAGIAGLELTPILIGIALVEGGIFVGLALWTKTKPYTAISVGLAIFIGLWVLAIALSGFQGAVGGIIVKIIIISVLVSSMSDAKAWQEANKNK